IDPPGFALENFDVIGGWREHYRSIGNGEPVIVAGKGVGDKKRPARGGRRGLPGGGGFPNNKEIKGTLLGDQKKHNPAPAHKLLTYATGVPPTAADRPKFDAIVASVRVNNYGLRSLVHAVVQSEVFRNK